MIHTFGFKSGSWCWFLGGEQTRCVNNLKSLIRPCKTSLKKGYFHCPSLSRAHINKRRRTVFLNGLSNLDLETDGTLQAIYGMHEVGILLEVFEQ
jgi:hypothetical protein